MESIYETRVSDCKRKSKDSALATHSTLELVTILNVVEKNVSM